MAFEFGIIAHNIEQIGRCQGQNQSQNRFIIYNHSLICFCPFGRCDEARKSPKRAPKWKILDACGLTIYVAYPQLHSILWSFKWLNYPSSATNRPILRTDFSIIFVLQLWHGIGKRDTRVCVMNAALHKDRIYITAIPFASIKTCN